MGFGVFREWTALPILLLVILGLVVSTPLSFASNGASPDPPSPLDSPVVSTTPQFEIPLYGETRYVQADKQVNIRVEASDPDNDTVTITAKWLPEGASLNSTSGSHAVANFVWNSPSLGGHSLIFEATNSRGMSNTTSILLVVEDPRTPRDISLHLDRSEYVARADDTVRVTVRDEHADKNFARLDTIIVNARSGGNSLAITLTESEEDPRTFVGSFGLTTTPSSRKLLVGNSFTVTYNENGAAIEKTAIIAQFAIRFDRTIYAEGGEARFEIIGAPGLGVEMGGASIPVAVKSSADAGTLNFKLGDLESQDNRLKAKVNLGGTLDASTNTLKAASGDTITVSIRGKSSTARIFDPLTLSFGSATYSHTDLAELWVVDVTRNTNPFEIETIEVNIKTDGGSDDLTIPLRENGTDTGIFVNTSYIAFNRAGTTNPEYNIIGVDVNRGIDKLTAEYGEKTITADVTADRSYFSRVGWGDELGGVGGDDTPQTEGIQISDAQIVNCSAFGGDSDHDGICNYWEPGGSNQLRIYYPQTNGQYYSIEGTCNPCPIYNKKDVYVEIDYTGNVNGLSYKPYYDGTKYVALENAKGELAPVVLHYLVDDDISANLPDGILTVWSEFDQIKEQKFGTASERGGGFNSPYMNAKKQVFHYALFVKSQASSSSSGLAELIGNDIVVSLGYFAPLGLKSDTVLKEEGTFLHELGHNLGIHHGGGFIPHSLSFTGYPTPLAGYDINCKPNYPSVMSYYRQIPPVVGNLGDTTHFSRAAMSSLDVTWQDGLNESQGVSSPTSWTPRIAYGVNNGQLIKTASTYTGTAQVAIDWNNSGTAGDASGLTQPGIVRINEAGCGLANADKASQTNQGILQGYNDLYVVSSTSSFILDFRVHNAAIFVNGLEGNAHGKQHRDIDLFGYLSVNKKILLGELDRPLSQGLSAWIIIGIVSSVGGLVLGISLYAEEKRRTGGGGTATGGGGTATGGGGTATGGGGTATRSQQTDVGGEGE